MNRILEIGTKIKDPDDLSGEYTIEGVIGSGTTCVVYLAKSKSKEGIPNKHILKEYNPRTIALVRGEDNSLNVRNEKDRRAFSDGMNRFKAGITKQAEVRLHPESMNSTSIIARDFAANQTHYAVMPLMAGKTYDKVTETSLYNLLRRICAITKVVKSYHDQGLLHLDIKPENIFTLPETVELVQMFDFDSVIEKDKVISAPTMSYTQNWAAQEQILPYGRKRICEATDLFAIGEMLFYKLMGRHSVSSERYSYATYHFDPATELLRDADPKVFELLSEIFEHTICNVVARRWQSADILLGKLEEAIKKSYPEKHRLLCNLPCEPEFFVGRDPELSEIDNRLKQTDKLFITGMGGMGKSELCKQYAHLHKKEYDAVIFAVCNTDLESMIMDDKTLPIANIQMFSGEKAEIYFDRKYHVLQNLCNERVLLIVDNLNDMQDSRLNDILQLNCKMLITTRCDVANRNYEQVVIGPLEDAVHVRKLFERWYPYELSTIEDNAVEQILAMYSRHTLAIELIARQMDASDISPPEMLQRLTGGGFRKSGKESVVSINKDDFNAYAYIKHLFDVFELSDNQRYILANLSLLPVSGINKKQFRYLCELEDNTDINDLEKSGWVRKDTQSRLISVHPVIADIMQDYLGSCETMLRSVINCVLSDDPTCTHVTVLNEFYNISVSICKKAYCSNINADLLVDFINAVAPKFLGYGNVDLLMSSAKDAYRIYINADNKDDLKIGTLNNTLGLLYNCNSHFDLSEKCYLESIRIKETYNDDPCDLATTHCNLGNLYCDQSRFDEAKLQHKIALDIRSRFGTGIDKVNSFVNIATIHITLQEFAEAETLLTKAIEILQEEGIRCSADYSSIYNRLGLLCHDQARLDDAKKYYTNALDINLAVYGEVHINTAISHINLGSVLADLEEYECAAEHLKAAWESIFNAYGWYHMDMAVLCDQLGVLYADLEDYEKAELFCTKALSIKEKLLDAKHPDIAASYNDLGCIYHKVGRLEEAERMFLNALGIFREKYRLNHTHNTITIENLVHLYNDMGKLEEALNYQKILHKP